MADPEPSRLSPEAVLRAWTERWGTLHRAHAQEFLQRPEVAQLALLPAADVRAALRHQRRLERVLESAREAARQRILQAWIQRWGELREEHQQVFLQRPEVEALCLLPHASVLQAIERHRSLDAILHAADGASPSRNGQSADVHGVEESVPMPATNAVEAKVSRSTASSPSSSATGKAAPGVQPVVSAAKAGGRQQPKTRATKRAKRKRPATGTQPRKPRRPEHTDRDAFTSELYAGANAMRRQGRPEADLREQCSSCGRLVAPGEAHDC